MRILYRDTLIYRLHTTLTVCMTSYFIRRFLLIIPTFIGITIIAFVITRLVPGGPIERMIAERRMMDNQGGGGGGHGTDADAGRGMPLSEAQIEQLKKFYGFDKPILHSYCLWLKNIVTLDLGVSTRYHEDVWQLIKERLPISLYYGILTTLITYLICIPLGVMKALKHKKLFDNLSSILVFIGYAIPGYLVGIILIVVFAAHFEWFPLGGWVSFDFDEKTLAGKVWDVIHHSILPLIAYITGSFAVMTFLMKNSLMDNVAADYVRTAMAKGLSFRRAILRHAMRNSLIPLATHFGNNISLVLAGSFLIEKIFNIDGMGLLGFESVQNRDFPVVLGILVIASLLALVGNILSDICVAITDPRVQFK